MPLLQPMKRVDFATAAPSLDKLPVVGESNYEDEDDDDQDRYSSNSDSDGDVNGSESGENDNTGVSKKSKSKESGLITQAALGSPLPNQNNRAAGSNGAFGRWLSRRNNPAPDGTAVTGYPVDDDGDSDRNYFNRGLGATDDSDLGNASGEEEDEDELSRNHSSTAGGGRSNARFRTTNGELVASDSKAGTIEYASEAENKSLTDGVRFARMGSQMAPIPHRPPQTSYDVRAHHHRIADSADENPALSAEDTDSQYDTEDDNPEAESRYEWQHMLSNVLQGEVLKSEKTRMSGTLTNDHDDSVSSRKWRSYQIWLRVRAYVRGRSVQQEIDFLEEARGHIEAILGEVARFKVKDDSPISDDSLPLHDGNSEKKQEPDAAEQISLMVRKIEWCDCLYPSISAHRTEKAHVTEKHVLNRIDALFSWQTISKRLKTQIRILQKWTGSDQLEVTQPGLEAIDEVLSPSLNTDNGKKPIHHLLDTSPFIERIFKEDTLQQTFEKSTIADLYRLIHDAKSVMISCRTQFSDMNLPTFYNDVIALVNFPTNLIQEALKLRLNYVQNIASEQQPSTILVDQLTSDFRSGLNLAAKMKENYVQIMTPNVNEGWPGGSLTDVYDKVVLDSLNFFFKLLNWKLKSGSKAIYLKETEIVENEWKFLSEAAEQFEGGDLLVGEHFCTLTHRLLMRVTSYFEEQLQVLEERDMSAVEISRWINQTIDNVRLRHRKLLRFGRAMQQRFENAADYLLEDVNLNAFIHALAETEHFLVYTGSLESQAIYVIATANLIERQGLLRQMLSKCFATGTQADYTEREVPGEESLYLLMLSTHEPLLWTGAILNLEDLPESDYDIRDGRVRLLSDGPMQRLQRSKQVFYEIFPAFKDQVIVEQKAHLARINRELKKIKRSEYRLAESILLSVERVHRVLKAKPGSEASLANYFSFTADLGQRSLKHMEPALRARFSMYLMKFSIRWVGFICDDCVPSDSRIFKWAVSALEFAMLMTRNEGILRLAEHEFAFLRAKVASCMTLLISHFDILGARSSFQAKQEKERLDVAREEVRKQLQATLAYLNNVDHIREYGAGRAVSDNTDGPLYFDDQSMLEGLSQVRQRIVIQTETLEQKRADMEAGMRVVGRVLDEERPEDKSLLFLATSNSNISLRWQQGKFIGGGTFGSVYLAVNLDSGGLMAVKEIKFQDLSSAPHLIKQIRDEMQVMEMLSHPNIVEYYGIEVHRDKVYIFEEYCQGGSLANLLEHGRIEDESVMQIYTVQMLDGLMYLHNMNVVHRDIKPDNILLDHMGVIKYVDFGAAKVLAKNQKTMAAKTRAPGPNGDVNSLTGTPMYMSPEVIKGGNHGRRGAMDIWSLGCVVLECATGRRPWSNLDNEWAIMFHIGIATKHPPLPERHELSELGIDFIEACLNIDPKERPSAAELMEHPWIQQFSAEIAHEMFIEDGGEAVEVLEVQKDTADFRGEVEAEAEPETESEMNDGDKDGVAVNMDDGETEGYMPTVSEAFGLDDS